MSISSILKRLAKALPVLVTALPGVLDSVQEVRRALKKSRKSEETSAAR